MTSAAKPKRRPPFTTLATRLMLTSFSTNSLSSRSRDWRSRPPRTSRAIGASSLERQPAFAGGVGQGLDPAMKHVAAAVEHHGLDAGGLAALGDQLADRLGGVDVGAALGLGAQHLVAGRGGRERDAAAFARHLGVEWQARAADRQARPPVGMLAQLGPDAPLAAIEELVSVQHGGPTSSCLLCARSSLPRT